MVPCLKFGNSTSLDLVLRFAPDAEFRQVVDAVRSIRLPPIPVNEELAAFSVLELLSNSMRAHRERGVREEVALRYSIAENRLEIEILDSGRGFDPGCLPYSLDSPPEMIDPKTDSFAEYRLKHGGGRFGMGLLAARKTFPGFRLSFVDKSLGCCPWYSGKVRGTRIVLSAPLGTEAYAEELEELPLAEDGE